jgi:hypothetical protein
MGARMNGDLTLHQSNWMVWYIRYKQKGYSFNQIWFLINGGVPMIR